MHHAFLLLGSNQNDPASQLEQAITLLKKHVDIKNQSSVYRSEPWGIHNQAEFLNQVLLIQTNLGPEELLATLQAIETHLGRQRKEKWGPRSIDIDILFYENTIINQPELVLPHPHIQDRRFTLVPLAEIASTYTHPVLNKTILQLLNDCPDELQVFKMK